MSFVLMLLADAAPTASAPERKEPLVCVREDITGSRVGGKKVCRTRSETERLAREASENVERSRRAMPRAPNGQ